LKPKIKTTLLAAELVTLYILVPLILFCTGIRSGIFLALWVTGIYAVLVLKRNPDFTFQKLWHGDGWTVAAKRQAALRFLLIAILLTILTITYLPEKFLRFPVENFWLWLLVMALYPVLSAAPQELIFRSFFFTRYNDLIGGKLSAILINGLLFGFCHITFNNWIAPICSFFAGVILAHSYQQHRSLKLAVIEHALYGCLVFTIGIGGYFFTGDWRI
jgi:membrane protease YdiL (CAAX protease family)